MSPATAPWTGKEILIVAGILVIAAALRIGCAIAIPSVIESDYYAYWTIAQNIAAGRGLVDDTGAQTAFFNLGYPMFLAAPLKIFGAKIAVVKTLNVLLGIGSTALVYISARQLFGSRTVAAISAVLFATYLEAVIYTTYVAKENLMMFLMLAQIALAVTKPAGVWRYANPILFGIATGTVAMVGNAAVILLPALAVQVYFMSGSLREAVRYLAIAAVTTIIVIAPLMIRNHQVFGAYVLNNGGGVNLYLGNNELSTPFYQHAQESPLADQWQHLHTSLGEAGMDGYLGKLAVEYIEAHPGKTLALALRKGIVFWNPPTHAGKYEEGLATRLVRAGWLIEYLAIGALFLAATPKGFREYRRAFVFLWLLVGSYTAEHMVFYVIYRYRLPIMPVLCMGAGVSGAMLLAWLDRAGRIRARLGLETIST
jgi:4-amino-4-deoxy-L-arabinose transferase-like glycosyltransferase